jgi:hypothetical protein
VAIKTKLTFPTNPKTGETNGWREEVTGARLDLTPSANPRAALAVVQSSMAPAPVADMRVWLAELSTVTARRAEEVGEAALTLTAYTKRLEGYPGDVVKEVLSSWSGKWFPTWGELKEVLDSLVAPRAAILARLQSLCPEAGPATPRKSKAELTKERDDRVKFGMRFREKAPDGMSERDFVAAEIERLNEELQSLEG